MKSIRVLILTVFTALNFACAAGVNFKKMDESQLVLGKTTKEDAMASMGKPNRKGTNTFNGIDIEIINYAYAKVGGSAALPGVTPARSQGFLFRDGILVGKEYTSSFAIDSTLFDIGKAKTIIKGQTKSDVVSVMGQPKGEYLYPIIENQNGHAYVYIFTQTKGFKSKSDIFVVEFDDKDVVVNTKLSSTGQL